MTPPDTGDIATLSYEAARDELTEVVRTLEAGSVPLEAALQLWERGEALAAHCQAWLDGARRRLDDIQSATAPSPESASPESASPESASPEDGAR